MSLRNWVGCVGIDLEINKAVSCISREVFACQQYSASFLGQYCEWVCAQTQRCTYSSQGCRLSHSDAGSRAAPSVWFWVCCGFPVRASVIFRWPNQVLNETSSNNSGTSGLTLQANSNAEPQISSEAPQANVFQHFLQKMRVYIGHPILCSFSKRTHLQK